MMTIVWQAMQINNSATVDHNGFSLFKLHSFNEHAVVD